MADLYRWQTAYANDRVISSELREKATAPVRDSYGYGWQVMDLFGSHMYNHTGGIDGFSSHLAYYPEEELLVIVLSNSDKEDSKATACDLAALIFDVSPAPAGNQEWLLRTRDERCPEQ